MGITITENAAKHMLKSLHQRGKGIGLRIGLESSGCSGYGYKLEYVDEARQDDQLIEAYGITVFIDPNSLIHLDGMTVDFVRQGLNEGYVFDNPNAVSECGCGKSFSV